MARFIPYIPKSLQDQLNDIGKGIDTIAPQMIDEALPILADSVKKNIPGKERSGDLGRSVKPNKAKPMKRGGYYGMVRFAGKSVHKYKNKTQTVTNDTKVLAFEYGTSEQDAQPFLSKSVNDVEDDVIGRMQYVFNKEVEKI